MYKIFTRYEFILFEKSFDPVHVGVGKIVENKIKIKSQQKLFFYFKDPITRSISIIENQINRLSDVL